MPLVRTKKVTPKEQRIAKVIKEIQDGTLKNVTVAAKSHYVPYYKLYYQFHGRLAAETSSGHNKALFVVQRKGSFVIH